MTLRNQNTKNNEAPLKAVRSRPAFRTADPCVDVFFAMLVVTVILGLFLWNNFYVAAKPELVLVQVLFRHGLRTPLEVYPTDLNLELWPKDLGSLTDEGRLQQKHLAQFLKQRYHDFLNDTYDKSQIHVRSSNKSRTIESAKINLRETFKGPHNEIWPEIETVDYKTDYLLNARSECKRRKELWSLFKEAPEYKETEKQYANLLANLSKHAKMEIDLDNYWVVEELTEIELQLNKPIPLWVKDNYKELKALDHRVLNFTNGFSLSPYKNVDFSLEILKVVGGPIWSDIINRTEAKIKSVREKVDDHLRYYVYSGHDMIISAIFGMLGGKMNLDKDGYPGPASCLIFELWMDKHGDPTLKIFYRDDKGTVTNVLKHLHKETLSWKQLKENTDIYLPDKGIKQYCHESLKHK
ncbi:unnamed protein product [Bursaphelenchus okinawaensis]|uniref:acid phosphatase n=1 Tax=Bursaphelenchus okinawaensis TaxID=465554 RepID=A0A811LDM8_9BILA|nr:unnamed protein product [Bursaphelenchus okinawaensis]CAG9120507.1 unnamed protein product [Bursaphelenchus okinawaensis]